MMHPTEQSALTQSFKDGAATTHQGMRIALIAAAVTICATGALSVASSSTNVTLVSQPITSTASHVATGAAVIPGIAGNVAVPAMSGPTMATQELADGGAMVPRVPSVVPHLMATLGLPLAAIAAFFFAFRRATSTAPAPLSAISIAPVTSYKVVARPSLALGATPIGGQGERYEVELEKPIGITLARGNDGATYVAKVPPGERYAMFTPGDRVTKCSASFGPDIWEALNYGQVMFAIKTRNGNVFLELEKRGGDMSIFERQGSSRFMQERNSGNYGAGTAEVQMKNYAEAKELERKREAMWREAVEKVKQKKYEDALVTFENIIGLEPAKYIGDNFAMNTDIFRISHYQMACVYSLMGNTDAALESLRESMNAGFDDFKQIRSDPDLARLRETEEFEDLMSRYDESVFNADAINALKGVFGGFFGGKK